MAPKKPNTDPGVSATLLIKEVDQELRAQRLHDWWERFGNHLIALVILVVLATAAYAWWQSHVHSSNQAATSQLLKAERLVAQGDQKAAIAGLKAVEASIGLKALADLHAASLLRELDQKDEADALLRAVAAQSKALPALAYYADLSLATNPPADKNIPFYYLATEMQALRLYRDGDKKEALAVLDSLALEADLPSTQRERILQLKSSIQP